jgi:hypothetical protein
MVDNRARAVELMSVYDGDTFWARIFLAPGLSVRSIIEAKIRVKGWSAKELDEVEGPAMRNAFERHLRAAKDISIVLSRMSHDRIVADVYLDGEKFAGLLNLQLRRLRLARSKP